MRPEEIQTRRPMLAAALQMQPGWDGAKGPRPSRWFWDAKPETRDVPSNGPNLTGLRHGRLVCMGLAPKKKGSNNAAWIVRCDCGRFETRTAKALRNEAEAWQSMCEQCHYAYHLRRKAFHNANGRWPTEEEKRKLVLA